MAKVKVYSISKEERYQLVGEFFEIVSQLKNKQEVIDFFVGILFSSESLMIARRIQIAKLIVEGYNYREIKERLKVSSQTIGMVYKWLHERDEAYKVIIKKYLKKVAKQKKNNSLPVYNESELDKYPQYKLMKKILGL